MTPEGKVKRTVSALLKSYKSVYYFMPVQNGMGAASLDYLGSCNGRAFAVETKKPGGKPTARQELTIAAMKQGGMAVFVIDGDVTELRNWLDTHHNVRFPETPDHRSACAA